MPTIDFELILKELDESTELLSSAEVTCDFSKTQLQLINTLIVRALEKYHEQLNAP